MCIAEFPAANRQGKTRLSKWYEPFSDEEKTRMRGEVHRTVAPRDSRSQSNFVEVSLPGGREETADVASYYQYKTWKLVYRRYAGLFFTVCVDANDNELAYLESVHLLVEGKSSCHSQVRLTYLLLEVLDSFFGNVCELGMHPSGQNLSALISSPVPADLLFNFHKVYAVLDEVFLAGEIEETSKSVILSRLEYLESLP